MESVQDSTLYVPLHESRSEIRLLQFIIPQVIKTLFKASGLKI